MSGDKGDWPQIIRMSEGPPVQSNWAQLLWAKPGRPVTGIITQWPMHQVIIHWVQGANLMCYKPWSLPCRGCEAHIKKRWLGFVGAYDAGAGRHIIMEVTAAAAAMCPDLVSVDLDRVNWRLTTWRMGHSPNSRMAARLLEPVPGSVAPPALNYARIIYSIFGLDGPPVQGRNGRGGK